MFHFYGKKKRATFLSRKKNTGRTDTIQLIDKMYIVIIEIESIQQIQELKAQTNRIASFRPLN